NSYPKVGWCQCETRTAQIATNGPHGPCDDTRVPMVYEPPPRDSRLRAGEIHLWYARLTASPRVLTCYERSLERWELERASRYGTARLRQAFTIGRGILRLLAGRYLDLPAAAVRFAYGERGKPRIEGACKLRFNLAHSGDRALYAFSFESEIGVDV